MIDTPLVPTENAPSSSGWHNNVMLSSWPYDELSLHSFFLGFPKLHVEVWFFFDFFTFGCWQFSLILATMITYYPHKTSIERVSFRFELPVNNFTTTPFSH
jgi:hypothetical protein